MALVVETGDGIPNADSYVSVADATMRAAALGLPFPSITADAEIALRGAALYLEQYRNRYQGSKVYDDQSLQWPRDPVYIDNVYNEPDNIPTNLIDAQISIASASHQGAQLFGSSAGTVTDRTVGDVSVKSSNSGRVDNSAYLGLTGTLLQPLFNNPSLGALEFAVCRA